MHQGSDLIHQLEFIRLQADDLVLIVHAQHQFAAGGIGKGHHGFGQLLALGQLPLELQGLAFTLLDIVPEGAGTLTSRQPRKPPAKALFGMAFFHHNHHLGIYFHFKEHLFPWMISFKLSATRP